MSAVEARRRPSASLTGSSLTINCVSTLVNQPSAHVAVGRWGDGTEPLLIQALRDPVPTADLPLISWLGSAIEDREPGRPDNLEGPRAGYGRTGHCEAEAAEADGLSRVRTYREE